MNHQGVVDGHEFDGDESMLSAIGRVAAKLRARLFGAPDIFQAPPPAVVRIQPVTRPQTPSADEMRREKLLIIDDDEVVAVVYETLFRNAGYAVRIAEDGERGLAAVKEFRPDAVLLDLSMPGLNGLQWLEAVRKQPRFKKLPVVVLTSGEIAWQVGAARNADTVAVLSKRSSEPSRVLATIRTALETGAWGLESRFAL